MIVRKVLDSGVSRTFALKSTHIYTTDDNSKREKDRSLFRRNLYEYEIATLVSASPQKDYGDGRDMKRVCPRVDMSHG